MIKSILVPLDGSALAEQALPLGVSVASRSGARLILAQVTSVPMGALWSGGDLLELNRRLEDWYVRGQSYLDNLSNRIQHAWREDSEGKHAPLDIHTRVLMGEPGSALGTFAIEENIDLIVMSTHGATGLTRWARGSVADKLLQTSQIPILALRPSDDAKSALLPLTDIRAILLPLDGSTASESALPLAVHFARQFEAEVILFRAATLPVAFYAGPEVAMMQSQLWDAVEAEARQYLKEIAERLTAQGLRVRTSVTSAPAAESILSAAEANHVDMIVMTTHGRTGWSRLAFGSVADRVLRSSHHPVLMIRAIPESESEIIAPEAMDAATGGLTHNGAVVVAEEGQELKAH